MTLLILLTILYTIIGIGIFNKRNDMFTGKDIAETTALNAVFGVIGAGIAVFLSIKFGGSSYRPTIFSEYVFVTVPVFILLFRYIGSLMGMKQVHDEIEGRDFIGLFLLELLILLPVAIIAGALYGFIVMLFLN